MCAAARGKVLGHTDRVATTAFIGVALLAVVAPFEMTQPLVRFPQQSVSNLEAALLCAFAAWSLAIAASRQLPSWRTPLTSPWLALLAAVIVASVAAPAF